MEDQGHNSGIRKLNTERYEFDWRLKREEVELYQVKRHLIVIFSI